MGGLELVISRDVSTPKKQLMTCREMVGDLNINVGAIFNQR
jgi:hypothetical protein